MDNEISPEVASEARTEESSGNAALDKRLATGVLKGDSGTDTAQVWISAFLIAALGFIVYLGSFSIPLHGADLGLLHDSKALHRIVTSTGALELLPASPLAVVGLAVGRALTGGGVDGLHGLSILLHLGCAVLIFLMARRLLPAGTPEAVSMLAGMLFVAHPLTTGTVNYLAAYPVLQSSFWGLLGINLLLRGAEKENFCVASLSGAVLSFAVAFGSDTAALLLPVLGIAFIQIRGGQSGSVAYRRAATPTLVLTLVFLWAAGAASGLFQSVASHGFAKRAAAFLDLSGNLLLSFLLPLRTPVLPVSPGWAAAVLGLVLLLALLAGGLLRRQFPVMLGAIWVLLSLFSAACYGPPALLGTLRYLYLPLAGLSILLPWALSRVQAPTVFRIGGGLAAVLVLVLGFMTFQRTATWQQPDLLWRGEAERHPDSVEPLVALARFHSAVAELAPGQDEKYRAELLSTADTAWKAVLERVPGDVDAEKHLGMLAVELARPEEAQPLLESVVEQRPEDQEAALYLAYALEQRAQGGASPDFAIGALRAYRRAERLGVLPKEAQGRYGVMAASFGDFETGLSMLKAAAGDDDKSPFKAPLDQFSKLAEQVQAAGQRADAALSQNPGAVEGAVARAEKLLMEGRTMSAFYLLQLVIPQTVGNDGPWAMLGVVSARIGGAENFLKDWGPSRAGSVAAWEQLGFRCAAAGAWDAAELYIRYGLSSVAGAMPELKLATIAMQAKQPDRAMSYVDAARKAYPDSPAPWLQMADMSIEAQNFALARGQIDEAEKRGATPEEVKARRDKLGSGQSSVPTGIQRTVIQ